MNHQHRPRRGTSTVEFALTACTIIGILVLTLFLFGKTVGGLFDVADNISVINDGVSTSTAPEKVTQDPTQQLDESVQAQQSWGLLTLFFTSFNTICVIVVGFIYVRIVKNRKEEEKAETCRVQFEDDRSDAIKSILNKRNRIHSDLRDNWIQLFQGKATIRPYMSTGLVTVRPEMELAECDKMLQAKGYRRFMVTDEEGRLRGVISRKDIKFKQGKIVSDIMTSDPKTAGPDTSLRIALTILLQHRVTCLPIVEEEKLVGLLSSSDLMIVLQCILVLLDSAAGSANANSGQPSTGNEPREQTPGSQTRTQKASTPDPAAATLPWQLPPSTNMPTNQNQL